MATDKEDIIYILMIEDVVVLDPVFFCFFFCFFFLFFFLSKINKNIINLSSAEFAQRVVKVKRFQVRQLERA